MEAKPWKARHQAECNEQLLPLVRGFFGQCLQQKTWPNLVPINANRGCQNPFALRYLPIKCGQSDSRPAADTGTAAVPLGQVTKVCDCIWPGNGFLYRDSCSGAL